MRHFNEPQTKTLAREPNLEEQESLVRKVPYVLRVHIASYFVRVVIGVAHSDLSLVVGKAT